MEEEYYSVPSTNDIQLCDKLREWKAFTVSFAVHHSDVSGFRTKKQQAGGRQNLDGQREL